MISNKYYYYTSDNKSDDKLGNKLSITSLINDVGNNSNNNDNACNEQINVSSLLLFIRLNNSGNKLFQLLGQSYLNNKY